MLIEQRASTDERVLAAMHGAGQFAALTDLQRTVAHALIDADIEERAAAQSFGTAIRDDGLPTVGLDGDGKLVESSPDGSRRLV